MTNFTTNTYILNEKFYLFQTNYPISFPNRIESLLRT